VNDAAGSLRDDEDGAAVPLRVEFITKLGQLPLLKEQWEALNRHLSDHEAPFFQSHGWNFHVAKVRLERSSERYRLCVATVWRGHRMIGIWPLSVQRRWGVWIAKSLDDPFGQFAGVLFENKADIVPGVAAVLRTLRARKSADALQIDSVVNATSLHEALMSAGARNRVSNTAVYVDLRQCRSFDEFMGAINKKTRKNLRNLWNRLRRVVEIEHVISDQRIQLRNVIEDTFEARLAWIHEYGRTSPAFRDQDFRPIVRGLSGSGAIELLGFSLVSKDGFVSSQWGFTYLGRYYAYLSAKNSRYDEFSPGRLHLGMVIEACKARGIEVLELMPPAADYKLSWSDRTKRLDVFVMPMSVRGYLVLNPLVDKIGFATRSVSRLIPQSIRRPLVRLLNRS